MADEPRVLDPVVMALVQSRLDYISRHMGWVMTRTARGPNFNQSHDFSCFIADAAGTLVSQADGIPIHTGGGGFAVRALLGVFDGRINDGDVFLLNDPYVAGGNHLPDWTIARPVFVAGRLAAFTCNRAHQSDIGGGAAGTYNSAATEIFHEGIRLPPMKLIDRGETSDDLWRLLMLNTRTPDFLDGDLRAMIGSTRIGAERIAALLDELGVEAGLTYFEGILDHAERRFRSDIASLPDGVYRAVETTDNDCFERRDIAIRLALTIDGDEAHVDFTGTDGQMRGFKNSSLANTYSAVYMALASFFEPDLPRNEGTFRPVSITAPEGTVVNALPPAPMTMCTTFIAHEIIHVVWKALAQADPARSCAGWGKTIHGVTSGRLPGNDSPFVINHWNALAAGGAVDGRDGFNQIGHLIALGGLILPNIENYEQLYPLRFLKQEFHTDGGGAGRFRGGTGVDYAVDIKAPAEYSFHGEGIGRPSAFGITGGDWGGAGHMTLYPEDADAFDPPQYGIRHYGPLRMTATSPGGGGWGDPLERNPQMVADDVRDGFVSPDAAYGIYGVVLADGPAAADVAATEARRGVLRQARSASNDS